MILSRRFGILIASALLALLVLAPSDTRSTHAGIGEPPPNDDFADATVIRRLPFQTDAPMEGATPEADEPVPSCVADFGAILGELWLESSATTWYRFTSTDDTLVSSAVFDAGGIVIAAWIEDGASLIEVGCGFERLSFDAVAGTTYFIQLGSQSVSSPAVVKFSLRAPAKPANDDIADAINVESIPFAAVVDTHLATNEAHEPTSHCVRGGNTTPPPAATIWYRFPADRDLILSTDTAGSNFSTVLNVYLDTPFGPRLISCGTVHGFDGRPNGEVVIRASAGNTYLFQVGGDGSFEEFVGELRLRMRELLPPENDTASNALPVTALPAQIRGDITAATGEGDPVSTCINGANGVAAAQSAWYEVAAGANEFVKLSVDPELGSTSLVVSVFEENPNGSLVELACGWSDRRGGGTDVGYWATGNPALVQVATPELIPPIAGVADSHGPRTARFSLLAESFTIPACRGDELVFDDPAGDVLGFFGLLPAGEAHDVRLVGYGMAGEHSCVTIGFEGAFSTAKRPPDGTSLVAGG